MSNTTDIRSHILAKLERSNTARSPRLNTIMADILAGCPSAGTGVHHWLFVGALKLHRFCPDKGELAELLALASSDCGREVSMEEIDDAINNSRPIAEGTAGNHRSQAEPPWPKPNQKWIEAITKQGPNLDSLIAMSPVKWNDDKPHTEEVIDSLFPGNPLLCAGLVKERSLTRLREEWRGFMANQQFIVPSPMSARFGKTKDGKVGARTLDNTGPRRFLVVEFDQGTFDQHAALLVNLAEYAPLALVVHSGNKSLHGWFFWAGEPEEKVKQFFRYAVTLGADPHIWTKCQFVRMPDGRRENGNRQRVVFFNPQILQSI